MRLSSGGLIDRENRIRFTYDGHTYEGFDGDTLASALMANGLKVLGRSFKYHRPRGVMTAGPEEPNALVTLGAGQAQEPNLRATTLELYDGLNARSQNCWPSVNFDILAMNDLAAPFFSAGFYYKTFMWPRAFWEKLYEPMIRRAAGLGALSGDENTDRYERAFAHCDVLVIGAGPAGLMAAYEAAQAGADVILADEDSRMGGRLNSDTTEVDGQPGSDWAAEMVSRLAAMDNVRCMPRTTVTGAYDTGTYSAMERVAMHEAHPGTAPREAFWRIVAKRAILAAGSLERPIAFQNNDRPGIMMAGAVRTYLNRYAVAPGRSVAVFGNNDSAHDTVRDLQTAGIHVAALIDSRPGAKTDLDVPFYQGQVCGAEGRKALEAISIATASGIEKLQTDCLAVSGGWNPSLHLTCHMGGRPEWDEATASFHPNPGMVPGLDAVGAANGVFSTAQALQQGQAAAQTALSGLGMKPAGTKLPKAEDGQYDITPMWSVPGKGRAWLDFQNDVTVKDVKLAATEAYRSVEHMKRYTTQGMAPDQGKNSNMGALAVLADATGRSIPETGTTTYRAPYAPMTMAAVAAGTQNKGFAPERFTTSHAASEEAPKVEAGLWYRPSYFPKAGETNWRQSCDREVGYVRNAVGICDVSTLGKVDIQGPDAGEFLDFVYTNMFSTLKVGRARYGLMLREDGHVMDDGTTARLSENHYLMTTTTAAAGQVMRHLEFVRQALRPDLDVQIISATEQWAQFAVAGPKSRELINGLLDTPITDEDFPFMGCGPVSVGGINARLFRISFSGEHAYEIAVPARYGESLFRTLRARAEEMGGGAYGMEALNVLRIEKGFITHSEIHGRVTAFDIGMQGMMSKKKDFFGKTASQRPGLMDPDRERLIGLKPVGVVKQLTAGAHLFNAGDEAIRVNDQGYITSVGFSPTLGHFLGLGFLRNGPDRIGEEIRMVDHLRRVETTCEVVNPVFFDPEGGRARD
ncbi:sarcosine oxidase subunit alpha family protein [Alisedimentitalea sp. MJ-SS2]|uniref:sarcosine oxidase subunit alpha family protein n=1 Tax=Aliisedimentitalea sp. MJ-SS2 TaxID=3049795 RepID=UPI002907E87C|nr:sarcosine oxidase subunit alpha family protein [Alisedimentitalea sp. MJ-SS2]MDU8929995.1 sarcosine oxidase subunit alpha family protein [Alisedimentitalea sp. MJ-SS2]